MSAPRPRSYSPKKRSKADRRIAVLAMLTLRATMEGVTPETLARSYGLTEAEAQAMLMKERARRAAAGGA